MVHFQGNDYRTHTSCISEAQKYQGHLYREKATNKQEKRKSMGGLQDSSHAMIPRKAYVEDDTEGDYSHAVAIVDVPPRAPTPPPAAGPLPDGVNVFDFLVTEDTPSQARKELKAAHDKILFDAQRSASDVEHYTQHGFTYGHTPVQPAYNRYDSYANLGESQDSMTTYPPSFVTPGPETRHKSKDRQKPEKSDKKRKRYHVEDLDLSATKRPMSRESMIVDPPTSGPRRELHTGLTGGLSKLITDPEFYADRIDAGPTPISPVKRYRRDPNPTDRDEKRKSSYGSLSTTAKTINSQREILGEKHSRSHARRDSSSSIEDRRSRRRSMLKAIEYPDRAGSVQPSTTNQLVTYSSRAELFLSFVNKGPDSERGCSINKALKRYHRERDVRGEDREEDDKELWKSLRVRRNDRGEIVLFI